MPSKISTDTIKHRLINAGRDISAPDYLQRMQAHVAAAEEAVQRPVNPLDENVPENFKRLSGGLQAFGRLGTMLQVVLISGGIGPIINLGLIVADTIRVNHAISFFEHSWPVALLLSVVTIFSYTYLAFVKADLKYILRKNERERFSLRRVRENITYWLGRDKAWQPVKVTQSEIEYERVTRFYMYFKMGIFVLLFLSSMVTVIADMQAQPEAIVQHLSGAVGSVVITMLLLSALDLQIDRSYKAYMQTDGGQQQSVDFFGMELERYFERRRVAGEEAERNFMLLELRNISVEAAKELPAPQPEVLEFQPPPVYTNGHSKAGMEN
jgi:hypothetical protein